MNFPIEFKGERVLIVAGIHETYIRTGHFLTVVPQGETVHVCGYCHRDSQAAAILHAKGYEIFHGVCAECEKAVRAETERYIGSVNQQQRAQAQEGEVK